MRKNILLLALFIIVHFILLFNLRYTAWPEMLSFPYMISKGFVIYKDFHHVYQPLLTISLLGFYKLFGFSLISLKAFTWASILVIDLAIFFVSKKIIGNKISSFIPLGLFVFIQPIFEGNMLWYDLFVTIPILIAVYFAISWSEKKSTFNLFLIGVFLSISFLVKQQSALLYIPFVLFLLLNKINIKDFGSFILGSMLPILGLLVTLNFHGILNNYLFWTFTFPIVHLPKFPGYVVMPTSNQWIVIFTIGILVIWGLMSNQKNKINRNIYFLTAVLLFEVLSGFPRFSYFHLQPALATLVLIVGYLIAIGEKKVKLILLFIITLITIPSWELALREVGYETRFYAKEEIDLSKMINETSKPEDKIYLLGPHSSLYVISDRISPKPWIENYVWHFEIPGLQEKVISGWKIDPPKYIYWSIPNLGNWYDLGTYQPKDIIAYIKQNYVKTKQIDNIEIWSLKE